MVKINPATLPGWYQRLASILSEIEIQPQSPIAGSFALWLWRVYTTGKAPAWSPSDIDFWFSSEVQMLRTAVKAFSNLQPDYPGSTLAKRGPAIVEIQVAEDLPMLQFIHRNTYGIETPAPGCFLGMFDLSVTQVAIEYFHSDTVEFVFGDDDVRSDIAAGACRCFRDMKAPSFTETNTPSRIVKYQNRGFRVAQGEVRKLVKWAVYYDSK